MMLEQFKRDLELKNRSKNTLRIIDFTLGKAEDISWSFIE
jgi:hypothetical protein